MFEDSKLLGEVKILKVKVISGRMPNTIRWDDLTGMPLPLLYDRMYVKGRK